MGFKSLGEALFVNGFTETAWYPQDAFAFTPPREIRSRFDPTAADQNDRYDRLGVGLDASGTSPRRAKGNLPSFYHGREATYFVTGVAEKLWPMEEGWDNSLYEEDLKYVCRPGGISAYGFFLIESQRIEHEKESVKAALTAPEDRAEELRTLANSAELPPWLWALLAPKSWPAVKPFAVAALRLYRALLAFHEESKP